MMSDKKYREQIRQLALRARAWARAHPEKQPQVAFNYPETTAVISGFQEAVENGFIVLNDDGRELIASMVKGIPRRKEPTPTMIRLALDIMDFPDLDRK